ncbi:hypothetical protein QYE76_053871 [Lolium multiflorum]|uniref:F-box domain-containing protein n=1 Tax=Lolium multiflorum TaxID=4521 RepID=A0AAD8SX60_LOLMU|nr:hypothetical protein QYE76_053871 [Lolium multiflorum]
METVPAAGRDRLSHLPDCLLHIVLSSLRSRQAVQTCLLSRRWRHLWRLVPCLDVDQRDFLLSVDRDREPDFPGRGASDAELHVYSNARKEKLDGEMKRRRSFEDFADSVLPLNGTWPLDAYRLHVSERDLREASRRWIRRGLARRPVELSVAYGYDVTHHDYPWHSFDFISAGGGALHLTSRLRKLHLYGLTLSGKFAEELGSECPVLEDLKLVNCEHDHPIASLTLKMLHIEGRYDSNRYTSFGLLDPLAVPALVSLNLHMVCLPNSEDEFQSLAVASITYPCYYANNRFLKSLRKASVLELRSFTTTGLLEDEPQEFRQFHNLRTLILIECDIGDGCQVLRYVLENVPNLKRLVLKDCKTSGRYRGESATSFSAGTAFHGCDKLKYIQIKYKGDDVPHVLVAALTQIAKDVICRTKRSSVGWLDWMRRVVPCSHIVSLCERYNAASVVLESDNSLSDEEHQSYVCKNRARKKHDRDGAIKARRRAAHPARR